jgi:hypothetical protein
VSGSYVVIHSSWAMLGDDVRRDVADACRHPAIQALEQNEMLRAAAIALPLLWRKPQPVEPRQPTRGGWRRGFVAGLLEGFCRPQIWVLAAIFLSGCSMAPDTLCQLPRPRAALADTADTISRQKAAAAAWDSRWTVRGWVERVSNQSYAVSVAKRPVKAAHP